MVQHHLLHSRVRLAADEAQRRHCNKRKRSGARVRGSNTVGTSRKAQAADKGLGACSACVLALAHDAAPPPYTLHHTVSQA